MHIGGTVCDHVERPVWMILGRGVSQALSARKIISLCRQLRMGMF
ncbi:MAG: hypothetical protein ACJAX2_001617 [Celeribacter sp.]